MIMSQKAIKGRAPMPIDPASFAFIKIREDQDYINAVKYFGSNIIQTEWQRSAAGRVNLGGLFTTTNSLGPVKSLGLVGSALSGSPAVLSSTFPMTQPVGGARHRWLEDLFGSTAVLSSRAFPMTQLEVREVTSPAAEEYARSLGAYGSLILARNLVWETFPVLGRLSIDRQEDLDEGGYPVIRFTITTPDPVERVLDLDDQLKNAFCRMTPPRHQPYFTSTYQFES